VTSGQCASPMRTVALALFDGREFTWVWIGTHDEYERIIG
jgi:hypothetical protein